MATAGIARKMKRSAAGRAAVIHAPTGYEGQAFPGLPQAARTLTGEFDWIQIFVRSKAELDKLAPKAAHALQPSAILWIAFPKGSSGIQTDLTRDKGWEGIKKLDLRWIALISVNETWSAFGLRHYRPGEARSSFR